MMYERRAMSGRPARRGGGLLRLASFAAAAVAFTAARAGDAGAALATDAAAGDPAAIDALEVANRRRSYGDRAMRFLADTAKKVSDSLPARRSHRRARERKRHRRWLDWAGDDGGNFPGDSGCRHGDGYSRHSKKRHYRNSRKIEGTEQGESDREEISERRQRPARPKVMAPLKPTSQELAAMLAMAAAAAAPFAAEAAARNAAAADAPEERTGAVVDDKTTGPAVSLAAPTAATVPNSPPMTRAPATVPTAATAAASAVPPPVATPPAASPAKRAMTVPMKPRAVLALKPAAITAASSLPSRSPSKKAFAKSPLGRTVLAASNAARKAVTAVATKLSPTKTKQPTAVQMTQVMKETGSLKTPPITTRSITKAQRTRAPSYTTPVTPVAITPPLQPPPWKRRFVGNLVLRPTPKPRRSIQGDAATLEAALAAQAVHGRPVRRTTSLDAADITARRAVAAELARRLGTNPKSEPNPDADFENLVDMPAATVPLNSLIQDNEENGEKGEFPDLQAQTDEINSWAQDLSQQIEQTQQNLQTATTELKTLQHMRLLRDNPPVHQQDTKTQESGQPDHQPVLFDQKYDSLEHLLLFPKITFAQPRNEDFVDINLGPFLTPPNSEYWTPSTSAFQTPLNSVYTTPQPSVFGTPRDSDLQQQGRLGASFIGPMTLDDFLREERRVFAQEQRARGFAGSYDDLMRLFDARKRQRTGRGSLEDFGLQTEEEKERLSEQAAELMQRLREEQRLQEEREKSRKDHETPKDDTGPQTTVNEEFEQRGDETRVTTENATTNVEQNSTGTFADQQFYERLVLLKPDLNRMKTFFRPTGQRYPQQLVMTGEALIGIANSIPPYLKEAFRKLPPVGGAPPFDASLSVVPSMSLTITRAGGDVETALCFSVRVEGLPRYQLGGDGGSATEIIDWRAFWGIVAALSGLGKAPEGAIFLPELSAAEFMDFERTCAAGAARLREMATTGVGPACEAVVATVLAQLVSPDDVRNLGDAVGVGGAYAAPWTSNTVVNRATLALAGAGSGSDRGGGMNRLVANVAQLLRRVLGEETGFAEMHKSELKEAVWKLSTSTGGKLDIYTDLADFYAQDYVITNESAGPPSDGSFFGNAPAVVLRPVEGAPADAPTIRATLPRRTYANGSVLRVNCDISEESLALLEKYIGERVQRARVAN